MHKKLGPVLINSGLFEFRGSHDDKKRFGMIILAMLILLNGCGGPKSDTLAESVEKGNYYWSEGPARVITLDSEKEYLEERKLAVHWESGYILTKDAVWK